MPAWPAPIRIARGHLPAEMRLLRGGLGFVGGIVLVFGAIVQLLGGNWQLGFRHDWVLTAIFFAFLPGAVGFLSPLWFWLGRPRGLGYVARRSSSRGSPRSEAGPEPWPLADACSRRLRSS